MTRLIDADALNYSTHRECAGHGEYYDIEIITKSKIDNAPTIDAGWIPCSERLPKEYAQYLVCFEDGECYVYWLEDSDWGRGMVEKEGIIAWMPLPKPYREDSET